MYTDHHTRERVQGAAAVYQTAPGGSEAIKHTITREMDAKRVDTLVADLFTQVYRVSNRAVRRCPATDRACRPMQRRY